MSTENTNQELPTNVSGANRYKSIDQQLKMARIAIENAVSQADLSTELAKRGYDSLEMTQAKVLLQKAEELHLSKKDKYGDKYEAKDDFDTLKEAIADEYEDHSDLARIALKNDRGDLEKLQLNAKKKLSFSGWIGQVKAFYTNALASVDIKAALAKKGITEAELQAVAAQIVDLEKKEAIKFEKKGAAQNSTAERDDAIDELLEWYKEFIDTAKVTFKKSPQLLEKLGIVAR
ncbi:MAG: hypothetical protein ACKVOU_00970 [Cytophagales bacterium]